MSKISLLVTTSNDGRPSHVSIEQLYKNNEILKKQYQRLQQDEKVATSNDGRPFTCFHPII